MDDGNTTSSFTISVQNGALTLSSSLHQYFPPPMLFATFGQTATFIACGGSGTCTLWNVNTQTGGQILNSGGNLASYQTGVPGNTGAVYADTLRVTDSASSSTQVNVTVYAGPVPMPSRPRRRRRVAARCSLRSARSTP